MIEALFFAYCMLGFGVLVLATNWAIGMKQAARECGKQKPIAWKFILRGK